MKRAIKNHASDFGAIIALLVLAIVVSVYILGHERLHLPFVNQPMTINAEFSTAQAITPGQGQYVTISGVHIGEIGNVALKNGIAVVQLNIKPEYQHAIHQNATALLRPRTGLKDMFIEVDPGTNNAPPVKAGYTIPVSNTLPDVNTDEILSALNADTRTYLNLLVNGAGNGLANRGNDLAEVFKRLGPTHQDLARLNGALAARGAHMRSLVNSLGRLNTALAQKSAQIVALIDASAKVFSAFASENANLSRSVRDLPGTLSQTTATLVKVQSFANTLGPAAHNLLPAAAALPSANAALAALAKPSTPIIKNQIRPFVVAARPLVRNLRPVSINLAKATPNLSSSFSVLNHLFNMLGYSPSGGQHGYLWWLAWLDHNVRTLFSVQDANGPFRPLFIQLSCQQLGLLTQQPPGSPLGLLTTLVSGPGILNLKPADTACQLAGLGGTNPNPGLSALLPPQVTGLLGQLGLSKDKKAKAARSRSTGGTGARARSGSSNSATASNSRTSTTASTSRTSTSRKTG